MTLSVGHDAKTPTRLVGGLVCATGILLMAGAFVTLAPRPANALPKYSAQTHLSCSRCHINPAGGGPRTTFGKAFAANGHKLPSKTKSHKAPPKRRKQAKSSAPQVLASQKPDQWLASHFKGTEVLDAKGKQIGSVTDILFDSDGKIEAYVVEVGDGTNTKEMAIVPRAFQIVPGKKGEPMKLKLSMGEKQLKQAPKFSAYKRP